MFDWDEGDRFSFEDSDRFEEDSLCSWISEPESLCNNWRGWKKQNGNPSTSHHYSGKIKDGQVLSLVELSARIVACHIPFEVVEHVCPPVPEQLQLRIAFWSFPENEEDVRLYSCLANGSADEFQRGEHLFRVRAVKDLLQIGFHLSATVIPPQTLSVAKGACNVAVTFDRCRITSCNCTCNSSASWCSHLVAVCLHRIHQPSQVRLRAPVSESLSRLQRDQLQKFAQYLISELPQQQILPTAQRLLDELLSNQQTSINTLPGAPDPTAGASADAQTSWCLDESTLHENIRKILIKLCVPSPMVFSDVNYLSSTAPPAAAEWTSLLRPLRGREPEGMWNLLSIVREMFRRSDRNAIPLLAILTEEVLSCDQILVWWFNTKVSLHTGSGSHGGRANMHSNTHASQHACSSLCDEIVVLWRLAALNPVLSPQDRKAFFAQLHDWHLKTVDKVWKLRNNSSSGASGIRRSDIEVFTGFKPAMEACLLDWSDYPISGVTFNEGAARHRFSPYFHLKPVECQPSTSDGESNVCHMVAGFGGNSHVPGVHIGVYGTGHVSSHNHNHHHTPHCRRGRPLEGVGHWGIIPERRTILIQGFHTANVSRQPGESNRSSLSSEGFCENDTLDLVDFLPKSNGSGTLAYQVLTEPKKGECSSASTEVCSTVATPGPFKAVAQPQLQSSEEGPDSGQPSQEESKENDADSDCSTSNGLHANGEEAAAKAAAPEAKGEASESQQSSDEYQLYYYDPHAKLSTNDPPAERKPEEERFVVSVKKIEDPLEVLFARAEALHAHGYTLEACTLAVKLAEQLLVNPPDLMVELPAPANRGKRARRFNPASHQISLLASATLAKTAFLCSVLSENTEDHHLAFCVGLFGLEMARPPASTKALEVKLANQEQDIVLLLKRIPLREPELRIVKERAEQLRDGHLKSRGEALLPLMLASYIFDALVLSGNSNRGNQLPAGKTSAEENLGFEAVVAALGLKANVSEAEHPLLCEGIRRQRGELAINLVVHYKDDQEKLAKIMDKLLDKEVHQMYKSPSLNPYYYNSASQANTNGGAESCVSGGDGSFSSGCHQHEGRERGDLTPSVPESVMPHLPEEGDLKSYDSEYLALLEVEQQTEALKLSSTPGGSGSTPAKTCPLLGSRGDQVEGPMPSRASARLGPDGHRHRLCSVRSDGASSPGWEEDYKAWEAKFRCTNFRTHKKHSAGMASIDSSAPETTSSDNSPTVVRKSTLWKPTGPGSDSGSSGESSDSFASSSSGDKVTRPVLRDADSPPQGMVSARLGTTFVPPESVSRAVAANAKIARFKGKRVYPSVPNQPSEASAHFMFEVAKTVLTKAGGNSTTAVLFTQPSSSQNHRGPHRGLHMCAFQIGLYALGLHNAVSPNWLSRTYSSHVSWITGQAMEIGSAAISFLIDTWEGHLTPPEVASLADRASRGRDPAMVHSAAELALSCLQHAHALNPNEVQRALIQCKEQSGEMLERACLAVETAAKGGGVFPEALFDVARKWHELYEESLHQPGPRSSRMRGAARVPEPMNAAYVGNAQQQSQQQHAQQQAQQQQQQQQQQQSQQQGGQQGQGLMEPSGVLPLQQPAQPLQPVACLPSMAAPAPPLAPLDSRPMGHMEALVTSPSPSLTPVLPQLACAPVSYALQYNHPYTYLQGLPPFLHASLPFHPAAGYTYMPLNHNPYYPVGAPLRPQNPPLYPGQVIGVSPPSQGTMPQPRSVLPLSTPPPQVPPASIPSPSQPQVNGSVPQLNQRQLGYLLSAYRVGMLAMETLARRVHDDRPLSKYARNPSYGEDVKWLLEVAKKLGTSYLQEFCICTVNSVASPFILHEIVLESAHYLARSGSATLTQPLRSHLLTPLIQKCQQMFIACTHFKMYHITSAEYDEFVSIIRSARTAFQMTPGGMVQFNELLQSLRRSKSCKKELWSRIASALNTPTI